MLNYTRNYPYYIYIIWNIKVIYLYLNQIRYLQFDC